ncbi:MAG TPA: glutaminyl-peptide cyclotransferase [Candidatus Kapabacteria bacterium]
MHSSNERRAPYFLLILLLLVGISSCKKEVQTPPPPVVNPPQPTTEVPSYDFEVVNIFPHDVNAFTQGLQVVGDHFIEGTGLEGKSELRRVDIKTGKVLKGIKLAEYYFGEGITVLNGKIYQLTYTSGIGFVYDLNTFDKIDSFRYQGDGWGLTNDGTHLIMSNGTDKIMFLDPNNEQIISTITVKEGVYSIHQINELEYINGEIYANVWQTDRIIRIDPKTGAVNSSINLQGILPASERSMHTDVLNGIAYDAKNDRLFVTGKYWPKVFEIKLKKKGA